MLILIFVSFCFVRSIRVQIKEQRVRQILQIGHCCRGSAYHLQFVVYYSISFFYGLNKRTPYPDLLCSSLSNEDLRVSVPQDKEGSLDERPNYWDPAPIFYLPPPPPPPPPFFFLFFFSFFLSLVLSNYGILWSRQSSSREPSKILAHSDRGKKKAAKKKKKKATIWGKKEKWRKRQNIFLLHFIGQQPSPSSIMQQAWKVQKVALLYSNESIVLRNKCVCQNSIALFSLSLFLNCIYGYIEFCM